MISYKNGLLHPAILSLFLLLVVGPLSVVGNKCLVDGTYLKIKWSNKVATIVETPDSDKLQEVGHKKCGFRINGSSLETPYTTVEFGAFGIETQVDEFCSVWEKYSICVCPFFGCNSLEGVFTETLITSLYKEGRVEGHNYTEAIDLTHKVYRQLRVYKHEKILNSVMKARNITDSLADLVTVLETPSMFADFKRNHSGIFPDEAKKQELIRQGSAVVRHATQVVATTETQPSNSDSSMILPVVIGVVVLLVFLLVG